MPRNHTRLLPTFIAFFKASKRALVLLFSLAGLAMASDLLQTAFLVRSHPSAPMETQFAEESPATAKKVVRSLASMAPPRRARSAFRSDIYSPSGSPLMDEIGRNDLEADSTGQLFSNTGFSNAGFSENFPQELDAVPLMGYAMRDWADTSGLAESGASSEKKDDLTFFGGYGGGSSTSDTDTGTSTSTSTGTWDFSSSSDYSFDTTYIQVSGGTASLKQIDTTHDSSSEFGSGTYSGTTYAGGVLTLDSTHASGAELDSSWIPQSGSLKAYWKMDNDWTDATGNGHDGTAQGAVGFSASAKIGTHAATFTGALTDIVTIPDADELDNSAKMSFSIWINPSVCDAVYRPIFSKRVDMDVSQSYTIFMNNCKIYVDIDTHNNRFASAYTVLANQWTMVTVVYDGTLAAAQRVKLYFNGGLESAYSESSTSIPNYASTLRIGSIQPDGGLDAFLGSLDDFAIWSTALTEEEVTELYQKQGVKYVGYYDSPVMSLGTSKTWSVFSALTPLPFLKELTALTSPESSSGYSSISGSGEDLSNGLIGLWHLNETSWSGTSNDVTDSSGYTTLHNGLAAGDTAPATGRFGGAASFDGSGDYIDLGSFDKPAEFTISAWVKFPYTVQASFAGIVFGGSGTHGWGLSANNNNGKLLFRVSDGSSKQDFTLDTLSIANYPNSWHHLVVMADGSNLYYYKDGALVSSTAQTVANSGTEALSIGRWGDFNDPTAYFSGKVDEVGIWDRALSYAEVLQLYRRGANRILYQMRSCDDSACSGEAWQGVTGSATSYFSELQNNSAFDGSGNPTGTVKSDSLALSLGDFSSYGFSLPANQYFQYRITMETDDDSTNCSGGPCLPQLSSVVVDADSSYYGGSPSIINATGIAFTTLSGFSVTSSGGCTPSFQLSNDGSNFYYWNGSSWASASGYSESASAALTGANISTFASQVGTGTFYFKAFLPSDSSQSCELDSVEIQY